MMMTIGYAAIVIVMTFGITRTAARRSEKQWQVTASFAILVAYIILSMVLWLLVLDSVEGRSSTWIITLFVALLGAVLVGLLPPPEGASRTERRRFWSVAATMRRPFYDWERARKQYQRG
jgi:bacteriorhodopsin